MTEYTKFDIPLRSGRQVWNHITSERSQEKGMVFVQSSGGRVLPKYEKGAKATVDGLAPLYRTMGHYLWSDELERCQRKRNKAGAILCGALADIVMGQGRKEKWVSDTVKLIPRAVMDIRWVNPPTKKTRGKLYEYTVLAEILGAEPNHWHRDHMEKWLLLQDNLSTWLGRAEQPLYDWMKRIKSVE